MFFFCVFVERIIQKRKADKNLRLRCHKRIGIFFLCVFAGRIIQKRKANKNLRPRCHKKIGRMAGLIYGRSYVSQVQQRNRTIKCYPRFSITVMHLGHQFAHPAKNCPHVLLGQNCFDCKVWFQTKQ